MSLDSLSVQIASATQRFSALQRRAGQIAPEPPRILQQALHELELALDELRSAQEHLLEQRHELALIRHQLEAERRKYWSLFDSAPDAYVVTTGDARIVEANHAAADLLNMSQRFLVGRDLSVFFCNERTRILTQATQLAESGGHADWVMNVRPRERAPFRVAARVVSFLDGDAASLRWMMRRTDDPPVAS